MNRRTFLQIGGAVAGGVALFPGTVFRAEAAVDEPHFKISLAEWSLHQALEGKKIRHLDFPLIAKKDYGIDCVELVDQFFADKAKDTAYLKEFKQRADGEGVRIGLIMLDTNGKLGAADDKERRKAVDNTYPWLDAAKFFGCRMVRINAWGDQSNPDELRKRMVEGCVPLADYAAKLGLDLAIENHGEWSSNADWLVSLVKEVNRPNFGTLPDFGNFDEKANRYDAVEKMMPYAKAVSAKAIEFTPEGLVAETDYHRMLRIVRDGGYSNYLGIETESEKVSEPEAIRKTHAVLKQVIADQARVRPIFNGRSLDGWALIDGGEWTIDQGVLVGRNGRNWSTNPEKTGSWLSTEKQYTDFRLELQYTVNKGGNSGVFIRSSHEKNPAFTGFEMQIYDAPGQPPSKTGPGSLYAAVAPTKNVVRAAGEWNTVTIVARGPKITVEMNGEKILETEQTRTMKGYVGLQNHDDKAVVRFRNIRLEEL